MPAFIGLDLAWGGRNPHGFCVLEGNAEDVRCTHIGARSASVRTLTESVVKVKDRTDLVIVALDAPVLFPDNPSLERPVDDLVKRQFGFGLSARKARMEGQTVGVVLGQSLQGIGFTLDPRRLLGGRSEAHIAFEVYPRTIHARWFGVPRGLAYKQRDMEQKRLGLREYQRYLAERLGEGAPGVLRSEAVQRALAPEAATHDSALKQLDDTLDGLTCALAAWLAWSKPNEWEMLGDMTGYMVMPRERQG